METKVKPQQPPEDKTGVIYSIPGSHCDKVYIGETGRTASMRHSGHGWNLPDGKIDDSAVATLLLTYVSHNINWENSIILDYEDDLQKNDNRCSGHTET